MKKYFGHLLAFFTIVVWGVTFVSSKILLEVFHPLEILILRFIIGYISLWLMKPVLLRKIGWKMELKCMSAGLSGVAIYYLLENVALTYTYASNVGVILAAAPFFIGITSSIFLKGQEKASLSFYIGFVIAMVGVVLISYNGALLSLNPFGDGLALLACVAWAFYSIFVQQIQEQDLPIIPCTRRIFAYGIVFLLIFMWITKTPVHVAPLMEPVYLGNLLFLGFVASAFCFAAWNYVIQLIGTVKSSVYIYLNPIVAMVASALVLNEQITALALLGTVFTLVGLIISEQGEKILHKINIKKYKTIIKRENYE